MIAVRKSMTEKGIALDRGYRDLNRIMLTQPSREDEAHVGSTPNTGGYQIPCEPQSSEPANMFNDAGAINYARRGTEISRNRPFYAIKTKINVIHATFVEIRFISKKIALGSTTKVAARKVTTDLIVGKVLRLG